jgi:hypothetical protein
MKIYIVIEGERDESSSIRLVTRNKAEAFEYIDELNQEEIKITKEVSEDLGEDTDVYSHVYLIPKNSVTNKLYWTESKVDYVVVKEYEV